ncbi:tribbles homolog 2 [Anabrus simplex]|uniref:tribbles homolog 2 n=1 Tax=Anabrus simplex TaxID=316456 RepID=UPI0034DD125E
MQVERPNVPYHLYSSRLKDQESPPQLVQNVEGECDWLKKPTPGWLQQQPPPSPPPQQQTVFSPNLQPSSVQNSRQFPPTSLVGEKYLMLEPVEGSTLCRCVNVQTEEELVCKVVGREAAGLLAAHYRVDAHPHINCLHEVLLGERYLYLVFPPAHGDLHSYVRQRKRLRESEARRLFQQMAETVRACHEEGIVLRDLKLRKFVFADSHRSQLKLETLEDAVVLEDPEDDLLQDKRGCPAYVSPEILRSHAKYSGRAADMWSLGVILYTMLVGRYPFNDSEHASLFAKISRGNFIIPDCLSSRAKCLIRSLLRREPSERLSAADVLLHPWLVQEERHDTAARLDQIVPEFDAK